VHRASITRAGVPENRLRRLGIQLDAIIKDSVGWLVRHIEALLGQVKRRYLRFNRHLLDSSRHLS
jgi:hypothetical protein